MLVHSALLFSESDPRCVSCTPFSRSVDIELADDVAVLDERFEEGFAVVGGGRVCRLDDVVAVDAVDGFRAR